MRVTRDQANLEDEIHQQFLDQIPYWPEELPIPMGDYVYFYNYTGGTPSPLPLLPFRLHYAKWYRFPAGNEAATVEILDENDYVKRAPYFYMGYFAPTVDGRYLAFNYDIVGDESYTLVIR